MKKVISIILCLSMLLSCVASFTSCKRDENLLVMATNAAFPPYEYRNGHGYKGIDIEIARAIAKELGKELEIVDIEFSSVIGGVIYGKYDFGMAGMTVTEERKKNVDFTDPYVKGIQSVIVRDDSPYVSYEEFYSGFDDDGNPTGVKEGIRIGVQQGTTGDIYASSEPSEWGFGRKNVDKYKNGAIAIQALMSGKISAVIIDDGPAREFVANNKGLRILEGNYTEEDYAICVAKGNDKLRLEINEALAKLKADGTIDAIVAKYIN